MTMQWDRKMDKEVHPLALQKTRHVGFSNFIQVREYAEERHPAAFLKVKRLVSTKGGSSDTNGSILAPKTKIGQTVEPHQQHLPDDFIPEARILDDVHALHASTSFLDLQSECSDTLMQTGQDCNMHSILHIGESDTSTICTEDSSWSEDDFGLSVEPESRLETPNGDPEMVESEDELEAAFNDMFVDESCKLKEEAKSTCSKVESFKIKWSLKRKKKKRQHLKVPQRSRKILFLGDMNTGKSNLITTYCKDRYNDKYTPTILHFCYSDAKVMRRDFNLILADMSGRDDFRPLRQCSYFKTDIAILCYSAGDRNTLQRIKSYWLPELKAQLPNCPFLIAETKKDLREDFEDRKLSLEKEGLTDSLEYQRVCKELEERVVPLEEGLSMAEELGAEAFFSTSAKYRVGTRKLLQTATLLAVKKSRRKRLIKR